jgi:virulence factor Mce-like protein
VKRRLSGPIPRLGRFALLAQVVGAVAFVALLLRSEGASLPFTGGGEFTIAAAFSDAGGIHTGERTPVLVAGVPSGSVTSVGLQRGVAIVRMRLSSSARGIVRRDASATIEPRSALEDLTIDIAPGSSEAPPAEPGMLIEAARTQPTTTLDRVTAVLDADTRAQLAIVVDQLAVGLHGRSATLRSAIDRLHRLLDPATRVAGALARRRGLITELVDALSRIGTVAERHDVALASSLSAGSRTLAVTARRQSELAASVQALAPTVSAVDGALARVRVLATPLVPTLARLSRTAAALPAALRSIRLLTPALGELMDSAEAFARDGAGPLHAAAGALGGLAGVARALTPAIARVRPIVSAVNERRQGIALLGERFSGVLSTNDANGPILRGLGSFDSFNPADFGFPAATGAKRSALEAKAARALTLTCLRGGLVACLVRYLVPGLPGSVR